MKYILLSIILNLVLLGLMTWFLYQNFKQKKQIEQLVGELNEDSLEHYLNAIKKKGFDFTLKPKKKS